MLLTEIYHSIQNLMIPDSSKCEVTIPTVTVNKEATLTITLVDSDDDFVISEKEKITVNVLFDNTMEYQYEYLKPIKEVDDGRYEASFTASRCGYYMISIIIDGHHIPGSPYKTPVDYRDYTKITEQDCSQVKTHYGGEILRDVAITPTGEVVIVDDSNCHVIVLDDKLELLTLIGQGSGNSRLVTPDGVAVTDNVIAVSDWGSHRVKKYSPQGEFLSVFGCYGDKNGQFNYPRGLAFNNNKLLYVVDELNHRVQVFQEDDTFAFAFGSEGNNPGQFQRPVRIAIDPNNNVLVTDHHANCIHLFTDDGQFIQTITSNEPYAITISPTGYLIAGHDGDDNKIRIWDPTHKLIKEFGKKGSKQGEFCGIAGMAIDSTGNIYVADFNNKRLQVISNIT